MSSIKNKRMQGWDNMSNTEAKNILIPSANVEQEFIEPKKEDDDINYSFAKVALKDIDTIEFNRDDKYQQLIDSVKRKKMINLVVLMPEYIEEIKAGYPFRKKTGRYNIVDGNKRVSVYKELGYDFIQSIVLPIDTSDETINDIKEMSKENISVAAESLVDRILKTKNENVTEGYHYALELVSSDLLIERTDNKFSMYEPAIDILADSILKIGLLQPLVVLPTINTKGEVELTIESGHRRNRAIQKIIKNAKDNVYKNSAQIIERFNKVPIFLLPLGASKEVIEAVYKETNILNRNLSLEDIFEHLDYFENVPVVPKDKEELKDFIENQSINKISGYVMSSFKALGFNDWKKRKTTMYLNIYFFGSSLVKRELSQMINPTYKPIIKTSELEWLAITYKDKPEIQNDVIENTIKNKQYYLDFKEKNNGQNKKVTKIVAQDIYKYLYNAQRKAEGMLFADIKTDGIAIDGETIGRSKEKINQIKKDLSNLEDKLDKLMKK